MMTYIENKTLIRQGNQKLQAFDFFELMSSVSFSRKGNIHRATVWHFGSVTSLTWRSGNARIRRSLIRLPPRATSEFYNFQFSSGLVWCEASAVAS